MKINGKIYYSIIILIWIAMSISLASAEYKQQNSNFNITDTCTLGNGLICDNTFTCNFTITYLLDSSILINNQQANKIGVIYYITLNSSQTTNNGDYEVNINCNNGTIGGKNTKYFTITPTGQAFDIPLAIIISIIGTFLVFILVFLIGMFFRSSSTSIKIAYFNIIYLVCLSILFLVWYVAANFLYIIPFLGNFLYYSWLIMMILLLPEIIISIGIMLISNLNATKQKRLTGMGYGANESQRFIKRR